MTQNKFAKLEKILALKDKHQLFQVNFEKPWWHVLFKNFKLYLFYITTEVALRSYLAILPVLISFVITENSQIGMILVALGLFVLNVIPSFATRYYIIYLSELIGSVYYSSVRRLLEIDPVDHVSKSSGQTLAKINRGSENFEDVMDIFSFDLVGIIVAVATGLITVWRYDQMAGITSVIGFILLTTFTFISSQFSISKLWTAQIETNDRKKATGLEIISNINFIRSNFASVEMDKKLQNRVKQDQTAWSILWILIVLKDMSVRLMYLIILFVVSYLLYKAFETGKISTSELIAVIVTFYISTRDIWKFGNSLSRFLEKTEKISDLFNYVRNYGKQSFTVLSNKINGQKTNFNN